MKSVLFCPKICLIFFLNSVFFFCVNFYEFRIFPFLVFLDSFLMIKYNRINQKACLINLNHETYTI